MATTPDYAIEYADLSDPADALASTHAQALSTARAIGYRGYVAGDGTSDGTILPAEGFTCSRLGPGHYQVVLNDPYDVRISALVSASEPDMQVFVDPISLHPGSAVEWDTFVVWTTDAAGVPADRAFFFWVGPVQRES